MRKLLATGSFVAGAFLLGACLPPGGEPPSIPDLPDQICELLPPGAPGCEDEPVLLTGGEQN